jgi:ElaB/YqjD/DUF883 family membrane-anchored ribosome-binding protein
MDQTHASRGAAGASSGGDTATVQRLEGEIEATCVELGRTAAELSERLTPSALMADVKASLRDTAVDTTRAAARSASEIASATAERTHDVAVEATAQVRQHPWAAAGASAGTAWLLWAISAQGRRHHALSRGIPIALAWTGVWLLWRGLPGRPAHRVSI